MSCTANLVFLPVANAFKLHYELSRAFSAKAVFVFINQMLAHLVEVNQAFSLKTDAYELHCESGLKPEANAYKLHYELSRAFSLKTARISCTVFQAESLIYSIAGQRPA